MVTSPFEKLHDVVSNGIAIDVFYAEESLFLDEFIGTNAKSINDASFGAFFGSLQNLLGKELILATTRIFEQGNGRYPLRSIPAAIDILRCHSNEIELSNRHELIKWLADKGILPDIASNER